MGYFNMSVRVEEYVDVELDTDEVLGNMDNDDILDYVSSNIDVESVLYRLDLNEIRKFVMTGLDRTVLQNDVLQNCSIPTLLRAIADKLDNQ